ncbi:low molecular weight protein-tyrosine-phosphatase [Luteimicrobium xylanilyticum]|uniref:protein-tyrosine-phosphatase n=1 Tax=Luteimicrobium xylanilyticum TaxID=1133546 RepID=A0A5P9QFA1_9MICO|nr:low molecular weight protein-tyrosine-phosphatase [Luteimicrobium xylanilyticum]QFV00179.1 Protein-tyrosine-phosphatase [Luteimicrobium xylanilyticum]
MAAHDPYRVMTVCTGNICRSPMAEVVLRERFDAAGLGDRVQVDSTGISDEEQGRRMDRRAVAVLEAHGYDLAALAGPAGPHRARQVRTSDLAARDLVLPMTVLHARSLHRLEGTRGGVDDGHVRLYRTFDPAAPHVDPDGPDGYRLDIDDPWYGDREDFESCLAQVEAGADGVVAFVEGELRRRAG